MDFGPDSFIRKKIMRRRNRKGEDVRILVIVFQVIF